MLRPLVVAALLVLVAGGVARAADDCDNATDQATMSQCAGEAFQQSDAKLNELFKTIESRLSDAPDTTKLLVKTQRAWVAFRDAECDFATADSAGGTVYPMVYAQCQDGLTQKRIADFEAYLKCEEGDLSCPVPAGE